VTEGWKVRLIHGPESEDEETLSTLHAAMDWATMKGTEYHSHDVDCLGLMQESFVLEPEGGRWFQYGMNYHWVMFERV
jgi:hypothetical protein